MNTTETTSPAVPKPIFAKVAHNTAAILSGRIASVIFGAGSSVLIVRWLGSEQFGVFSSLYAYVSLFAWLATIGIEPLLTRESARSRNRSGSIIATGVALSTIFAILATLLVVLFAPRAGFQGRLQLLVAFAAIELLLFSPLRLVGLIFQVDLRQWYGTGINLARQALWLFIIIFLVRLRGSLTSFVCGRLLAATGEISLTVIVSAGFLARPYRIVTKDFAIYLRACVPIALSALLAGIYLRIDQVMLHNLASDKVLGWYAAAVKVSELFELLPAALLASLFPVLAIAANDKDKMAAYLDRIFRYLMVAAGLLCSSVCVGSDLIVRTLYGPQFGPSSHLLSILIWSEIAVFFGSAVGNILVATNLQNYLIYPTIVGAVVNVVLNLVWIPRYAASGSAFATLVSYSLAWGVVLLAFPDTRDLVRRGLWSAMPVVLVSGVAVTVAYLLPSFSGLRVVGSLVTYVAGIAMVGTIKLVDLQYLYSALGQSLRRNT